MIELAAKGHPLAYVGDVVGTGSSRKSATNSVLWYMGDDIPCVPNKKGGGVCIGGKIAPIFFNTMEDSGALPIELDVTKVRRPWRRVRRRRRRDRGRPSSRRGRCHPAAVCGGRDTVRPLSSPSQPPARFLSMREMESGRHRVHSRRWCPHQ